MASSSWPHPLCLIESGSGNQLSVNEQTAELLASMRGRVVVVCIAGLWRTGKSYLMNLLAGSTSGFNLGSTIQAETKGIWIWVVDHPTKKGTNLVLLDTEGLGDTEKGDRNHDTWIFALTVLLSSTLVYNSKGTIDNDALEKLHFVTEIADHIKLKSGDDEDDDDVEFDRYFPGFVWCVRDFSLDLEKDGREITSHEYLEGALKLKKGVGKKIQDFNLPRECIRRYFPTRACFTFPAPVCSSSMMGQLETLRDDQLDPEFVRVAADFKSYINAKSKPKMVNGLPINGSMLAGLVKAYVDAIKNGVVPCIESAVKITSQLENEKAINNALTFYNASMRQRAHLPTQTQEELSVVHLQCEKETIAGFLKVAIFDDDQAFQKRLAEQIQEEYAKICIYNEQASYNKCDEILKQLCINLDQNVANGTYMVPGGYQVYCQHLNEVERQFDATPGKGIKSADALKTFLERRGLEGSNILAADEKIAEEEKKQLEARREAEIAEKQRQAAEEEKIATMQRMEDQQKSHEENVRQLQEKMQADLLAQREEHERLVTTRMAEQEKLLKEGFDRQAKEMEEDINRLKKEQAEAERRAQQSSGFGVLGAILRPVFEIALDVVIGRATKGLLGAGGLGEMGSGTGGASSGNTAGSGGFKGTASGGTSGAKK